MSRAAALPAAVVFMGHWTSEQEEANMTPLHQLQKGLREGLFEAWDSLTDGWSRLYQRAAGAITRFKPHHHDEERHGGALETRSAGWGVLAAEVFDDDDSINVRLEAPGLNKDDLDIDIMDGYLVVRGEKRRERERREGRYYVTECAYGQFERTIPLPDEVDASRARATYDKGVLRLELPKSEGRRRRRIAVDVH